MATVTIHLTDSAYNSAGTTRFRIDASEALSGLAVSDFEVNGDASVLNLTYTSGNSYHFNFGHAASAGIAGYIRFRLPASAVTPNLNTDLDWTIYWGTDGVLHQGATESVRVSRVRTTLNTVRWRSASSSAGQTVGIELQFDQDAKRLVLGDLTLTGDITTLSNFGYYINRQTYRADVTLPSSLAGGGSFTLQIIDLESIYPGLGVSEEWTLSWTENGVLSASKTADLPIVLSLELSENYVAVGDSFYLRLHYSKDGLPPPTDQISLVDGMTIQTRNSPNDRLWTYELTAPPTGKGIGVISVPENVIAPGNNAAAITFTYIDSINADISLSAAAAQNGETVLAQFDFDYDVPNFSSDVLQLGVGSSVLGAGGQVLGAGGQVLGTSGGEATAGAAIALDDSNRSWLVPVTLPQSGEGMLEIELPEDAIGFQSAAVMAEVQFAPTIVLNIGVNANLTLLAVIDKDFKHDIKITGNNISSVDVQGLLRGFYHQWNSTTGILSILGHPTSYYKDLEFEVIATDVNGTTRKSAKIDVIDVAPAIIKPKSTLRLFSGEKNTFLIKINNSPSKVEVEGTWAGLDHSLDRSEGVRITGDVPASGLGVSRGNLMVTAENSGNIDNPVEEMIPWESAAPINIVGTRITPDYRFYNMNGNTIALGAITYDVENSEVLLARFVSNENRVTRFRLSSNRLEEQSHVVLPSGVYQALSFNPNTRELIRINLAGSDSVQFFNPDNGNLLRSFPLDQTDGNNLDVAYDNENDEILILKLRRVYRRYSTSGQLLGEVEVGVTYRRNILVGGRTVFISSNLPNRVYKFSKTGEDMGTFNLQGNSSFHGNSREMGLNLDTYELYVIGIRAYRYK